MTAKTYNSRYLQQQEPTTAGTYNGKNLQQRNLRNSSRLVQQQGFDVFEVFFGVYTNGVEDGGFDVDVDAVFEEA